MKKKGISKRSLRGVLFGGSLLLAVPAFAAKVVDDHGNVGYDTAAECDAAVAAGGAKFYQPFTQHPPLKRDGEASVQTMKLSDLVAAGQAASALGYNAAGYARGSCDIGVGRSGERDGVSGLLIGKYIPFSPDFPINAYSDQKGNIVRATMKLCDNHFGKNLPRPLAVAVALSECYATVVTPARFETKTEQVVKVAASKRTEMIPATYQTISEQVLVTPEFRRSFPVPATYKTVSEQVEVKPASFREEPIPATYKNVTEQVMVKPASTRLEVIPAKYKTVTEQIEVRAASKRLEVIPGTYKTVTEKVEVRPASKRIEVVPATYKTVTEQVIARPETVRLEAMQIPYKTLTEQVETRAAGSRLEVAPGSYKEVDERVLVRAASKRIEVVPATFATVTEQVKISDESTEWKRGRAWISQARAVSSVAEYSAAKASGKSPIGKPVRVVGGAVDTAEVGALGDDVMCLVVIPAQYKTITKTVMTAPASQREIEIPEEYALVKRQVVDTTAATREINIPAQYGTTTRQVIDFEAILARGYKLSADGLTLLGPKGEVWTPVYGAGGDGSVKSADPRVAGANVAGYTREIRTPAEYRTVTREVIDQQPSTREIVIPGESKTLSRQVVDVAPTTREIVIPAEFKTVTRQVVDTPASTREIAIPAEYQTVTRRVVDKPASTRQIPIPAVFETVKRRVVDVPATTREEVVPAVYKAVTRQVVDKPASVREFDVPAQYETISYQSRVSEATSERRAILCESNATPAKILEIKQALQKAGYAPGRMDGVIRADTMSAVNRYQQAKKLPIDGAGYLNLETVKSLGVAPN